MKILIIGDSFVEGVAATNNYGWAQQLLQKNPSHLFHISGVGGDNILKILSRMSEFLNIKFDSAILEVGINDSRYRPSLNNTEIPINKFLDGVRQFASQFRSSNPTIQLFLIGLTRVNEKFTRPYKEDKFYINASIIEFDNQLINLANELNMVYITAPNLTDRDGLLSDGVHPSNEGHLLLYSTISKTLREHHAI